MVAGVVIEGVGAQVFAEEVGRAEFGGRVVAFEDYFVVGDSCGCEDAVVDYAENEVVDAVGEGGEG